VRTTSQQLAPIAIGTVSTLAAGQPATVANSGTVLAPKLDFGIPAGASGGTPSNPNFAATASTLAAGASATAVVSGTYPNLTVAFGIPAGVAGTSPANPSFTTSVTTLAAGASATASVSGTYPNLVLNFGVPQGAAGSSASATPLASTTPANLGTAAVGTSTSAARADHVHNLPTGLLTQVATGTLGETLLVSLSLGVKRYTISAPGTATTDRLVVALTGAPSNATIQDAYVSAAGTVSVGLLLPALGIGSTVSAPVAIYKVS
jgi:hypothetical protein